MMTQPQLCQHHLNKRLNKSYCCHTALAPVDGEPQQPLLTCPIHTFDLDSAPDDQRCGTVQYSPRSICFAQVTDFPLCERSMSEHENEGVISGGLLWKSSHEMN